MMYLFPKCNVLLSVAPRVSALAGCYRLGIRALGYREHLFSQKPCTITTIFVKINFFKLNFQI